MSGRILGAAACMAIGLALPIASQAQQAGHGDAESQRAQTKGSRVRDVAAPGSGPRRLGLDWRTPHGALSVVAAAGLAGAGVDGGAGGRPLTGDDGPDRETVAMAAIAGGVTGFFVGLYAPGMVGEDPYWGLRVGPVLSVVSTGVSAHLASGRRGDAMMSIAAGLAATAVLALAAPEYGILLGPAVAIPIAVSVETR